MKLRTLFAAAALAIAACATTPTFNDLAADAESSVQLVQRSATALLRAGKITVAQDQALQREVGAAHEIIVAAIALRPRDPATAAAQLETARLQLVGMKARAGVAP